jgi:hypothetical protein
MLMSEYQELKKQAKIYSKESSDRQEQKLG